MEDDKTVFMGVGPFKAAEADADRTVLAKPETLLVDLLNISGQVIANYAFENSFSVGRAQENSVVVNDQSISRHHLEIKRAPDGWWVVDLNSTHGVYLDKQRVAAKTKLHLPVLLGLGVSPFELKIASANAKPVLPTPKDDATLFAVAQTPVLNQPKALPPKPQQNLSADAIKNRLLSEEESADMGDYTRMVRRVIREDRTVRTKNYKKLIWSLGILFVISAGLVTYQYLALDNARKLAINMFYDVKTLEVSLSQADIRLAENVESLAKAFEEVKDEKLKVSQERIKAEQAKILEEKKRLAEERQKLKLMKAKYQEYLKEIDFLRLSFPTDEQYERQLITRVVRGFGESELELPDEFVTQVRQYIKNWQDTGRLRLAIKNMQDNQYGTMVLDALDKEGLPAYFMYLPLQESNYDTKAIGPETRFGIAKGAWQFLATTGQEYGLPPGPLANVREYDEQDARFDFPQATQAGAKYLKYIYSKQAQASGLLVMASYNYGHNKVRGMVEKMPDNPRDRNFWKFIQQYEIPVETYDYVFYIVSAAVIGEDPKHFGFDFSPPLLQAPPAVN